MKNKKIEEGRGADFWQNLALVGLVGIVMTFMGFFWNVYSELGELEAGKDAAPFGQRGPIGQMPSPFKSEDVAAESLEVDATQKAPNT